MGLSEYRRKRDFTRSPEPSPKKKVVRPANTFVVQKHAATSLHYDLRLRVGDVLKSWAVPKGPSLDPREKRLAVEVEDHPLEYADFEGVIPEGQYGAGSVMVWDSGRWSPEGEPEKALADGMLKFRLEGSRLRGRWMLVRTQREARQPQWLLVKERDAEASPGVHAETFATSVKSGRTMDEIASGAPVVASPKATARLSARDLNGARRASMPSRIKPQLAKPAERVPEGDEWIHEVKFDGYRLMVFCAADSTRVVSRTGLDWTAKVPEVAATVRDRLSVDAVIDGEAVMLDQRGISDFQALQNAFQGRRSKSIVYFAFDLPWCDGYDLTGSPLEQRLALLTELIGTRQEGRLRYSQHVEGNGRAAFERVCASGLEGMISKKKGSPYSQSRSSSWIKTKCFNEQEFVVGGFSAPEGSREEFGALLVGYHDRSGALRFAGRVGTGFSSETLKRLSSQLRPIIQKKSPFVDPPTGTEARGVTWVKPTLVAQVEFREWTSEGSVRHTSFRGLREDLDARSVVREPLLAAEVLPVATVTPTPPPQPTSTRLTNPERIVFPDRGAGYALTKRQVAEYYEAVADVMLPHVANRPLAILRCPNGEGGKSFFQKHPAKGVPSAIDDIEVIDEKGRPERHLVIRDAEGLLGLVQMSALEFHPWGSLAVSPDVPDRLVFDLDPGQGVTWKQTVEAALMVRDALAQVKLRGFARTSGGKGVHVVVPLRGSQDWGRAKAFSKAFAETLAKLAPRRFVAIAGAKNREGRIFIDYLRNAKGSTAVAPYSTRARPGAPVALPVSWDELAGIASASAFTVPSVLRRLLANSPNPWREMSSAGGTLPTTKN